MSGESSCRAAARDAGTLARVRALLACRRCAVGWTIYLAAAAAAVAYFSR